MKTTFYTFVLLEISYNLLLWVHLGLGFQNNFILWLETNENGFQWQWVRLCYTVIFLVAKEKTSFCSDWITQARSRMVIVQTVNIYLCECVLIVKSIINMSSISLTLKMFSILYLPEPEYSLVVAEHFGVSLLENLQ